MKPEDLEPYSSAVWSADYAAHSARMLADLPFSVEGLRVLDLAGGPGGFTRALVEAGAAEVVWHDIEPAFAGVASERIQSPRVRFEVRDMMDLPYENSSFDAVLLLEALHWAADERILLRRIGALLREGGWLVLSAANFRRALEPTRSLSRRIAHLASPVLASVLGRKPWTTLWVSEWLTRRRLSAAGLWVHSWQRSDAARFEVIARRASQSTLPG